MKGAIRMRRRLKTHHLSSCQSGPLSCCCRSARATVSCVASCVKTFCVDDLDHGCDRGRGSSFAFSSCHCLLLLVICCARALPGEPEDVLPCGLQKDHSGPQEEVQVLQEVPSTGACQTYPVVQEARHLDRDVHQDPDRVDTCLAWDMAYVVEAVPAQAFQEGHLVASHSQAEARCSHDHLDRQAHQGHRARRARKARRAHRAHRAHMEDTVHKDRKAHKDHKGRKGHKDPGPNQAAQEVAHGEGLCRSQANRGLPFRTFPSSSSRKLPRRWMRIRLSHCHDHLCHPCFLCHHPCHLYCHGGLVSFHRHHHRHLLLCLYRDLDHHPHHGPRGTSIPVCKRDCQTHRPPSSLRFAACRGGCTPPSCPMKTFRPPPPCIRSQPCRRSVHLYPASSTAWRGFCHVWHSSSDPCFKILFGT
mmetsp:Transcript_44344/g.95522  ORF Transcript_44344/g.95522 Transcript_44344/m.95522 type:complete len:417 (+) Transcript_44344:153-1403(+)